MEHANSKPSRLESLPTELLEQIFLQCLNLNLPLASSHLSRALSSTRTKMAVVLKVFPSSGSYNLEHYTELSQLVWAGGASDTEMGIGELQSRILACRWMTWEFLKLCMETFVVKTLVREFRAQSLPWQEEMPVEEQPYDAPKLPWHGGAPVKESVVRDFVHEVFALKVHLGIQYEWELDDCELTEDEWRIRKEDIQKFRDHRANLKANGEEEKEEEFEDSESEDFDDDEDFDRGYQCLGVETIDWIDHEMKMIGDVIITPSLRTFTWGPCKPNGTPKISIGIGPRNGVVILGTRLQCETDSTMFQVNSQRWRCLFCRFDTNIPVKLLHGPWTEDQLSFLQTLIEAGADLAPNNETHRQMAKQGLTEAINEDDYRAVDLLISEDMESQYSQRYGDNYCEPSFGEAEFVMDVWDDRRDWVRNSVRRRTLGIKPDTEQLKLAVIERGCRRKIVKRLLWAGYSDIDRTDPAVVEWADKKKEEGDRNGQWLLDHLTKSGDRNRVNLERMERSSSYDFSIFAGGESEGTGSDAQSGDGDETDSQDDSGSWRTSSSQADIPPYETESEEDV